MDALLYDDASAWATPAAMKDLDWGLKKVLRFLFLNCAFNLSCVISFSLCLLTFFLETGMCNPVLEESLLGVELSSVPSSFKSSSGRDKVETESSSTSIVHGDKDEGAGCFRNNVQGSSSSSTSGSRISYVGAGAGCISNCTLVVGGSFG